MPFDLKNLNPATRFDWPYGSKEDGEYVELRKASAADRKAIYSKLKIAPKSKFVANEITSTTEFVEYLDVGQETRYALDDELLDAQLTAWRLLSDDGREIPCTRENKILFYRSSPDFAEWIDACLVRLRTDEELRRERLRKN